MLYYHAWLSCFYSYTLYLTRLLLYCGVVFPIHVVSGVPLGDAPHPLHDPQQTPKTTAGGIMTVIMTVTT